MKRSRVWSVVGGLALLTGCLPGHHVRFSAGSGALVLGDPSHVTVSGLAARQQVIATLVSTDSKGVHWRSTTKFRADRHGRLVLDEVALMGAMAPLNPAPAGLYSWDDRPRSFELHVAGASLTIMCRRTRHPVTVTPVTVEGLVGNYYTAGLPGRHSAVVLIGGSEGGLGGYLTGRVLAGHGYPVLALAYFKAKGLPSTLNHVPLEYFGTALRWLGKQPGVDAAHLIVDGTSRGGEAALLIGLS
jgi:hypothetical protein